MAKITGCRSEIICSASPLSQSCARMTSEIVKCGPFTDDRPMHTRSPWTTFRSALCVCSTAEDPRKTHSHVYFVPLTNSFREKHHGRILGQDPIWAQPIWAWVLNGPARLGMGPIWAEVPFSPKVQVQTPNISQF